MGQGHAKSMDWQTVRNIELKDRLFGKAADLAAAGRFLFLTGSKLCSLHVSA
jgi:hypothetical protein